NLSFAPVIAGLFAKGDITSLQIQTKKAATTMLAMSLPVFMFVLLTGNWILSFFGPEFADAELPLVILSGGHLIAAAVGPAGYLLLMTTYERTIAIVLTMSAGLNLFLNYLFITLWGIVGAAMATAVSIILLNITYAVTTRSTLGINPTVLPFGYSK